MSGRCQTFNRTVSATEKDCHLPGRHLVSPLLLVLLVAAVLVLPTVQVNAAPPQLHDRDLVVELEPVGALWRSGPVVTGGLTTLSADVRERDVQVRSQREDGSWTPWQSLPHAGEDGPDLGSVEAAAVEEHLSAPVIVDGPVQLRADRPGDLELVLAVTEGGLDYRADVTPPSTAEAVSVWPPMVPRSQWDPLGECAAPHVAEEADTVERIFVHHTVIFPDHAPEAGDDVVRAICRGHQRRGFSDVGYHFLIDRFGTIYQGRAGGILRPVVGAHAQGFNRSSVGIALIGNFDRTRPSTAAQQSLEKLIAWLSDLHGIEPFAASDQVSTGGTSSGFPEGTAVSLPTVVGHRDTGKGTACPGGHLYDVVAGPLRERVRHRLTVDYGWPSPTGPPAPSGAQATGAVTAADDPHDGHGHRQVPGAATVAGEVLSGDRIGAASAAVEAIARAVAARSGADGSPRGDAAADPARDGDGAAPGAAVSARARASRGDAGRR